MQPKLPKLRSARELFPVGPISDSNGTHAPLWPDVTDRTMMESVDFVLSGHGIATTVPVEPIKLFTCRNNGLY